MAPCAATRALLCGGGQHRGIAYLFRLAYGGRGAGDEFADQSIGGHGDALGGAITDTGAVRLGRLPQHFRGLPRGDPEAGACSRCARRACATWAALWRHSAHQIAVGAETLAPAHGSQQRRPLALAQWLEQHPAVAEVHYPLLPSHPQYARAASTSEAGSWLLSFELKDRAIVCPCATAACPSRPQAQPTRTLIIPVAHTIFWEAGPEVRPTWALATA